MKCINFNNNELEINRQIEILLKDWNYILIAPFMKTPIILDLYIYMGMQTSESIVVIDKISWSAEKKVYPYEVTFKMDQVMDIESVIDYIKSKLYVVSNG